MVHHADCDAVDEMRVSVERLSAREEIVEFSYGTYSGINTI